MLSTQSPPWYSPVLSLRWRLVFVYSGLFGIFVVILSIFLYTSTSNLLLNNVKATLPQHTRDLRSLLIQELCSTAPSQTPAGFIQQNLGSDISEIYLLNKAGVVIASSDPVLLNHSFPSIRQDAFSSTTFQMPQPFQGHASNGKTGDGEILAIAPGNCVVPQRLPAYIAVLTTYANEQSTLQAILFALGIVSAVMIIVGALIISFFTGIMLSPVKQMTRATHASSASRD